MLLYSPGTVILSPGYKFLKHKGFAMNSYARRFVPVLGNLRKLWWCYFRTEVSYAFRLVETKMSPKVGKQKQIDSLMSVDSNHSNP